MYSMCHRFRTQSPITHKTNKHHPSTRIRCHYFPYLSTIIKFCSVSSNNMWWNLISFHYKSNLPYKYTLDFFPCVYSKCLYWQFFVWAFEMSNKRCCQRGTPLIFHGLHKNLLRWTQLHSQLALVWQSWI